MTPTQRTLAKLRKEGYTCAVVEKVVPRSFIKQDLFGFIDIIAIREGETLAIQTTTNNGGNFSAHRRKILENDNLDAVRSAGWKIVLHGWWKPVGARSWACKEEWY